MKQHPVPRDIATYEFQLVGSMTLKQFGWLAGCCLIALAFYASHIPGYFKTPAVVFFVLMGAALAFLPIQERTLDKWISAFFLACFRPTEFSWKKSKTVPRYAEERFGAKFIKKAPPKVRADSAQLANFLKTLPGEEPKDKLEIEEAKKLSQIGLLFKNIAGFDGQLVPTKSEQFSGPPVFFETPLQAPKNKDWQKIKLDGVRVRRLGAVPPTGQPPLEAKKVIGILEIEPVAVEPMAKAQMVEPQQKPVQPTPKLTLAKKSRPQIKSVASTKQAIQFIKTATPTKPNALSGAVIDQKGGLVEGAIVEIKKRENGDTVLVGKTNRLGQFWFAVPLQDSDYYLEIDKDGLKFDIINVKAEGKIIDPIEIQAKA